MGNNYKKIYEITPDLYTENSPVLILNGALHLECSTHSIIAQLKFANISNKIIKALTAVIVPLDVTGNQISKSIEFQYLDIHAKRNNVFGGKKAIFIPNSTVRAFEVYITEVIFDDSSKVTLEKVKWAPLPKQDLQITDKKELEYLHNELKYINTQLIWYKDLWICPCGAINRKDEICCHSCQNDISELKQVNINYIHDKYNDTVSKAKSKKKRIFVSIISVILAIAVVLVSIFEINYHNKVVAYNTANKYYSNGEYQKAIEYYKKADDYKNSAAQIKESNYQSALVLLNNKEFDNASAAFKQLGEYKDSATKVNEAIYQKAINYYNSGKYKDAYKTFYKLNSYKDSSKRLHKIALKLNKKSIKNIKVGKTITYGEYAGSDIKWRVLSINKKSALIITKSIIDSKPYDEGVSSEWESCSLREWLNNDFYNTFTDYEKGLIKDTNTGTNTTDKLFLLSLDEVNNYFNSDNDRTCYGTSYAKSKGLFVASNGKSLWWLRTPKYAFVMYSNSDGTINTSGEIADYYNGVRPAMWISIK